MLNIIEGAMLVSVAMCILAMDSDYFIQAGALMLIFMGVLTLCAFIEYYYEEEE